MNICKTCGTTDCYNHCNHCFKDIKWLDYLGNSHYETNKKGKRVRYAYNPDDSVHRCMKKGQGEFINKDLPNEYILDEFRTIYRYSGPRFRCGFCGRAEDLPVMLNHHKDERFDCNDKLMKKFFAEKPKTFINPNNYRIDDY